MTVPIAAGALRSIHLVVGGGGSFGASPLQQHIGLGKAMRIETPEIWWPTSNTRQLFRNLGVNQFIEIREFAKDFVKLNADRSRWTGKPTLASPRQEPADPVRGRAQPL